jgi:glutathione S-transferase
MLCLYGSARSRGVRTLWDAGRTRFALRPQGLSAAFGRDQDTGIRALNPNRGVPTIDEDGFVLLESMAINLYLAKQAGKLYPTDAKSEALT